MSDVSTDSTILAPARRRRRYRWLLVVALLGFTTLAVLLAKVTLDWPAFADAIPWEIQQVATGQPGEVGRADVFDCWGNFIDSQNLWRVEVSPLLIPALIQHCEVVAVKSAEEVPGAFWSQLPSWWRPPRTGPARYFASPGFRTDVRGPDGQYYLMAYDEAVGVLYVWHKNNF